MINILEMNSLLLVSLPSSPVCVMSTGKSFSCISVPGTPPQFLHARKLSDYEVELSWQPPLEANSDILYYIVRVW